MYLKKVNKKKRFNKELAITKEDDEHFESSTKC